MIHLPQVTLIAVATRGVEATVRAMEYSCKRIEFGAIKLISPYLPESSIDIIHEYISAFPDTPGPPEEWNKYIFYNLGNHFDTTHCLFVHADGFVVNPQSWQDKWLGYDYIGAPWPIVPPFYTNPVTGEQVRVGNSVGLRSKKLCMLPIETNLPWERVDVTPTYAGNYHEDNMMSVKWKHIFEQHGCKFSSIEVAAEFSRETELPENAHVTEPFVFHKYSGRNNIYPRF